MFLFFRETSQTDQKSRTVTHPHSNIAMENDRTWHELNYIEHLKTCYTYTNLQKGQIHKYIEIPIDSSECVCLQLQRPRRSFPISSSGTSARLARRKTLCSNSWRPKNGPKDPSWMIIQCLITMVRFVGPLSCRGMGPLPNGRNPWLINGGY